MNEMLLFSVGIGIALVALVTFAIVAISMITLKEWSHRTAGHDILVKNRMLSELIYVDDVRVLTRRHGTLSSATHEFGLPSGQQVRLVVASDNHLTTYCTITVDEALVFDSRPGAPVARAPVDDVVVAARTLVSDIQSRDPVAGATARSVCDALEGLRIGGLAPDGPVIQAHRALGASDSELQEVDRGVRTVHDQLMATLRDLHTAVLPSSPLLTEDVVGRAEEALDRARAMREVQSTGQKR